MTDEAKVARSHDEIIAICLRLASVTPALRAAGDLPGIIAAVEQAAREIAAVLEASRH